MSRKKQNKSPNKSPKESKTVVVPGKAISDSEGYIKTFEIREKRIGIVFKTIYVLAIFFAAVFVDMGSKLGGGLNPAYIAEASVSAFFLMIIGYMVMYIFNEMKCLKLNAEDLPQKQIDKTEHSYSNIFSAFVSCGLTAILCMAIGMKLVDVLSAIALTSVFVIIIFVRLIISVVAMYLSPKWSDFWAHNIGSILTTVAIISLFLAPAFSVQ